jgi:Holliday junction resolvase-like predicted endonuclease
MPKVFTSKNQKKVEYGENIAVKYLIGKGFKIIERNYGTRDGEIDIISEIVTRGTKKIHFIEVKAVSTTIDPVTHETKQGTYRLEENMHPWKIRKFAKTVMSYTRNNPVLYNTSWQCDLVLVYIDFPKKKAKAIVIENITIS